MDKVDVLFLLETIEKLNTLNRMCIDNFTTSINGMFRVYWTQNVYSENERVVNLEISKFFNMESCNGQGFRLTRKNKI